MISLGSIYYIKGFGLDGPQNSSLDPEVQRSRKQGYSGTISGLPVFRRSALDSLPAVLSSWRSSRPLSPLGRGWGPVICVRGLPMRLERSRCSRLLTRRIPGISATASPRSDPSNLRVTVASLAYFILHIQGIIYFLASII